jgi:DNA polymerase III alpha subunit (gram-positive type)
MKYLFFDTETTGLPKNYDAPISDTENWTRLVQIAWIYYDSQSNIKIERCHIIKPSGFEIPANMIHNITQEKAIAEGISIENVLDDFLYLVWKSNVLIAHNFNFDYKIIACELFRINKVFYDKPYICTMNHTINFFEKRQKLPLMYEKLFGKTFENQHNAQADVRATFECYFKLKELGILL